MEGTCRQNEFGTKLLAIKKIISGKATFSPRNQDEEGSRHAGILTGADKETPD